LQAGQGQPDPLRRRCAGRGGAADEAPRKAAAEPVLGDALDRLSMGCAYADAETFRADMRRDNEQFKLWVNTLGLRA
jgi:hypothetical protein